MTALAAVGLAVLLAYRENARLKQERAHLLSLSSHLIVTDPDRLQAAAFPPTADDVMSWDVHVPKGKPWELRFGASEMSQDVMPENFVKVPISAGRHRVTLRAADSVEEEYRFTVFLDGRTVIDKRMGRDWMPDGWRLATGMSVPGPMNQADLSILQLAASIYTPRVNVGSGTNFRGQSDVLVTNPAYRLWIDQEDQTYLPASPFVGFQPNPGYTGIGLRDGLRYRATRGHQYEWTFHRPASQASKPALTMIPEFFVGDENVLPAKTKDFGWWQLRDSPQGNNAVSWQRDPMQSARSVFLHARLDPEDADKPVVELRWDASRPNDVGIRLPETAANKRLTKWRLRIIEGSRHLWRLLDIGKGQVDVRTISNADAQQSFSDPLPLELDSPSGKLHRIKWQTDISKPLQTLERDSNNANAYRTMRLFEGLPLTFEAEIAAPLQPQIEIVRARKPPGTPDILIPGGAVIEEIQIDLEATTGNWVWLRAVPRYPPTEE